MSFTIRTSDGDSAIWYHNQPKPDVDITEQADSFELYASGDELEMVKQHFVNVPYRHMFTVWRGDMAKFIFENL